MAAVKPKMRTEWSLPVKFRIEEDGTLVLFIANKEVNRFQPLHNECWLYAAGIYDDPNGMIEEWLFANEYIDK